MVVVSHVNEIEIGEAKRCDFLSLIIIDLKCEIGTENLSLGQNQNRVGRLVYLGLKL